MNTTSPGNIDGLIDTNEAGEALDFIHAWLAQAPPAVIADFERYAWPYTLDELRSDLTALATRLASHAPADPQP